MLDLRGTMIAVEIHPGTVESQQDPRDTCRAGRETRAAEQVKVLWPNVLPKKTSGRAETLVVDTDMKSPIATDPLVVTFSRDAPSTH